MKDGSKKVERLAQYLVEERRIADAMINEGCDLYPTWATASEPYKDGARVKARAILDGLFTS